jgi:hypothetical protein
VSPVALILGNLVPLVGVLAWGWDAAALVIFYWSENLVVGAITGLERSIARGLSCRLRHSTPALRNRTTFRSSSERLLGEEGRLSYYRYACRFSLDCSGLR